MQQVCNRVLGSVAPTHKTWLTMYHYLDYLDVAKPILLRRRRRDPAFVDGTRYVAWLWRYIPLGT